MRWAHNNLLKLNENIILFCRNSIFAVLQTVYTFHFEVKLYKYVVLGWKECLGVFYKRDVDITWRVSDCEELVGVSHRRW